jgi:protein-disulfide isomerase
MPGKVRLVYHDDPIGGPAPLAAAIAVRCANEQGRFWSYHDLLVANPSSDTTGVPWATRLAQLASSDGMDVSSWTRCLGDVSIAQVIQADAAAGAARGVSSVPSLFLNGTKLPSSDLNSLTAAIVTAGDLSWP